MPELVKLYIRSVVIGFVISAAFTAGLIWFDVARLGHLIIGSDIGLIAALVMVTLNGILFASVQFAFRIMAMAEDTDRPTGGRKTRDQLFTVPVTAPAKARRPS
jgi:hypothetical protein